MRGMGVGSWEGFHRTFASTEPSRGSRYARLPRPPHQLSNDITVWQTAQLQSQSNRWRSPLFLPNLYITGNRPGSEEGWYKPRSEQVLPVVQSHWMANSVMGNTIVWNRRCAADAMTLDALLIFFFQSFKKKSYDWISGKESRYQFDEEIWHWGPSGSYLIFVIFFTRAKFLENKIYTEKARTLQQNTQ